MAPTKRESEHKYIQLNKSLHFNISRVCLFCLNKSLPLVLDRTTNLRWKYKNDRHYDIFWTITATKFESKTSSSENAQQKIAHLDVKF